MGGKKKRNGNGKKERRKGLSILRLPKLAAGWVPKSLFNACLWRQVAVLLVLEVRRLNRGTLCGFVRGSDFCAPQCFPSTHNTDQHYLAKMWRNLTCISNPKAASGPFFIFWHNATREPGLAKVCFTAYLGGKGDSALVGYDTKTQNRRTMGGFSFNGQCCIFF